MLGYTCYNPSDEHGSCIARTLTLLSGKPYPAVRAELDALAGALGFDTYTETAVFEEYLARLGFYPADGYTGVRMDALTLPAGRFCVICTDGAGFYHMLPVIDSVIYDRRNDSGALTVFRIYAEKT